MHYNEKYKLGLSRNWVLGLIMGEPGCFHLPKPQEACMLGQRNLILEHSAERSKYFMVFKALESWVQF